MPAATVLKVTANGQISIPAPVRHRWNTERVIALDTPWGLVVRPYDPAAVDRIAGSFGAPGGPNVDELRRQERNEDARREAERSERGRRRPRAAQ
jgi:bifunctional DNA-binding transcriptional regulator/antitoxin component of YhaV-PrlF toxin-antitoxin module